MPRSNESSPVYTCPSCEGFFTIRNVSECSDDDELLCPHCFEFAEIADLACVGVSTDAEFEDQDIEEAILLESDDSQSAPDTKDVSAKMLQDEHSSRSSLQADAPKKRETPEPAVCPPLMEACTLDLYQKNIFRVTGLPVDASAKEVARQAQRLQMLDELGDSSAAAFPLIPRPTSDQIRAALARMKEPEHRLVDEFFWYWPEKFGASRDDEALQAVLRGDGERAFQIWAEREEAEGSIVARHNLAVLFHMFAVDWTNHHHASEGLDGDREETVKSYWKNSFERWEDLVDWDDVWDIVKDRVRSLADEALTTGFVRRMRQVLPQALDRVNAEAALQFAEQARIDWATFHVEFMRQTNQGLDDVESTSELVLEPARRRLKQQILTAKEQSDREPSKGAQIARELMTRSKPWMAIYDLFHGREAHQRADLFDEVADGVADMLFAYRDATGDSATFVTLLKQAVEFASGSHTRERLMGNITTFEIVERLKPLLATIHSIENSELAPVVKLRQMRTEVMPQLPGWATELGRSSEIYAILADTVANVLRAISIHAHNEAGDSNTASAAIELALHLVKSAELQARLADDKKQLDRIASESRRWNRLVSIRSDVCEVTQEFVRYNSTTIPAKDITGLRFGVFVEITNGVRSSSYLIGVLGKNEQIAIECKRFFRSESQAEADFAAILEGLLHQIAPGLVARLAQRITGGKPVTIGSLVLTKDGVQCETGSLWWKREHLVPYKALNFNSYQGNVYVSAKPNINIPLSRRDCWNAVIIEYLVEVLRS